MSIRLASALSTSSLSAAGASMRPHVPACSSANACNDSHYHAVNIHRCCINIGRTSSSVHICGRHYHRRP